MTDETPEVLDDAGVGYTPEWIEHKFTITARFKSDRSEEPLFQCVPEGNGITPDDCEVMAIQGVLWAMGHRKRLEMQALAAHAELMKQQQDQKRRVILPGGPLRQ